MILLIVCLLFVNCLYEIVCKMIGLYEMFAKWKGWHDCLQDIYSVNVVYKVKRLLRLFVVIYICKRVVDMFVYDVEENIISCKLFAKWKDCKVFTK